MREGKARQRQTAATRHPFDRLFLLNTIFVHRHGKTETVTAIDRAWLKPETGVTFWVDLQAPSVPESLILSDTMGFHPLSVEDAVSALQYPKAEAYDGYLYVVLHDIDFTAGESGFKTHDIDFFLGPNYLVTVHDGRSNAITELLAHCPAESADSRRWPGTPPAPHRRRDGGPLPARGGEAGRSPRRARGSGVRQPDAGPGARDPGPEARCRRRSGASPLPSAMSSRGSPGANSLTSARRWRSASEMCTTIWCGLPMMR